MNAFPKSKRFVYWKKPPESVVTFYQPFGTNWLEENGKWTLNWDDNGVKKYYLYQVFLHELGHIYDQRSTINLSN